MDLMLALMSTPSNGKVNWVQKCSLNKVWLSGKRVRGGGVLRVLTVDETSS